MIGGWTLAKAVETVIDGLPAPAEAGARFDGLLAAPARMTAYHAAFMAATAAIVASLVPRLSWTRPRAVAIAAATCFTAGIATVLSFNLWAGWSPLRMVPGLEAATVFDLLDDLTSNIMLPLGGLLVALFAGWRAPRLLEGELGLGPAWAGSLRWAAPALILAATLAPVLL